MPVEKTPEELSAVEQNAIMAKIVAEAELA